MLFSNKLSSARAISVLIGIVGVTMSLREGSLLKLTISAFSFYMPIVTIPFMMATFGFRSTEKSVILAMIAGLCTVLAWNYFDIKIVDNVIPAMLINLIVLVSSHYLLKQDGGWVGIKKPEPLISIRNARKRRIKIFIQNIKCFNLFKSCQINFPKDERTICFSGLFLFLTTFCSLVIVEHYKDYKYLLSILLIIAFSFSTALTLYSFWSPKFKNPKRASIIWNIGIFFTLICVSCLVMFISNFYWLHIATFFVSVIALLFLVRWQWALMHITLGTWLATFCYKNYIAIDHASFNLGYNIVYILSMISIVMLFFMKPKQDYQELAEEKIAHLEEKVIYQGQALEQALTIKNEFIRNISHETHIPVGVIVSNAQILWERYDNLTDDQRRQAARDISKSGDRLISLTDNMIDLSKLSSMNPELTIINMNISELVQSRLAICQRLYLEDRPIEFHRKIADNLYAECDGYYIRQTIDNLIINAIIYGKKGNVNIGLRRIDGMVEFSIEDEGIGIPLSELYDIFGAFTVSSKTRTPAGGRGVGLALCKRAIDVHFGNIWAESDGVKGSIFKFTLPVEYKGTQGKKL